MLSINYYYDDDQYCDVQHDDEAKWFGHLPTWHDYVQVRKRFDGYGPYRFFLTLTFRYELSDTDGQEALAKLWRRFMKKVLGKRWIHLGIKPMTGIALLEKAQLFAHTTREFGSCHFHLIVHDHPLLPRDDLLATMKMWPAFIDAAMQLTHKNRRWQLASKHGLDLKVIRPGESPKVSKYVAKEALRSNWKWDERVFYLGKGGI